MKDHIERTIRLDAPIAKVWKSLTDHREFGAWFRVDLKDPFELGKITHGVTAYPGHEGLPFWARTVRMEAPHAFSFRWPFDETIEPDAADAETQTTLVEFRLAADGDGTVLHLKESGFSKLPKDKRLQAFRDNEHGWDVQIKNIRAHVE